jgi:hypothetical protein
MKLFATYDFYLGQPGRYDDRAEIIRCGDEFEPQPTAQMSREEHAQSLIRVGAGMTPEKWAEKGAACVERFRLAAQGFGGAA